MNLAGGRDRLALVTGANGFIGSHLVEALIARGWRTRCLVRRTGNLRWMPRDRIELAFGDLGDADASMDEAVGGVSVVFHLAGLTSAASETEYERVNVGGTRRLAEAVARVAPEAVVVYCSSLAAAGPAREGRPVSEDDPPRPVSAYGRSKLAAERVLERSRVRHVVVRPPAVYGPRDVDILAGFRLARRGLAFRLAPRRQKLSIVHVHDLVAGICATAECRAQGVFYLTDGIVHTWEELVSAIAAAVGRRVRVVPVPESIALLVAHANRAGARMSGRKPLLTPGRVRELARPAWTCDDSRARRELGYTASVRLEQGMRMTAVWYRQAGWL